MSKVAGKRYTYKFDFNGLVHACQQMTATSAETLAISSATAAAAAAAAAAASATPPTASASSVLQQLPYSHPAATTDQFGKSNPLPPLMLPLPPPTLAPVLIVSFVCRLFFWPSSAPSPPPPYWLTPNAAAKLFRENHSSGSSAPVAPGRSIRHSSCSVTSSATSQYSTSYSK